MMCDICKKERAKYKTKSGVLYCQLCKDKSDNQYQVIKFCMGNKK